MNRLSASVDPEDWVVLDGTEELKDGRLFLIRCSPKGSDIETYSVLKRIAVFIVEKNRGSEQKVSE